MASRGDGDAIADVHIASWQVGYAHVFPAAFLHSAEFETERRGWWRDWTFHPGQRVAVVEQQGRISGFAAYGPERERSRGHTGRGEVYAFYLHPECWGDGSAAALIDHTEERLGAEGFAEAVLWVLDDNPRARAFYERHGWSPSGVTGEFDAAGLRVAEVEYRKELG